VTICKVWDADYPWDVRVEKVSRSLGREHEVHLVSRNVKRQPTYELRAGLHIHRLPIVPRIGTRLNTALGFPAFFNPLWIRAVGRTARRHRARLIMVRDLPLALTALLVGRALRVPVVLDMAENYPAMIRDLRDSRHDRTGFRLVRNPHLIRLVERIAVRHADHVITVVDESRDRLLGLGVPASRISVVMNTPTAEHRLALGAGARPGDSAPADGPVIAYLGVLEAPRGLVEAIQAMREVRQRLPRARLVVIGAGRDEGRFRAEANRAGVTGCVEFRGWLEYPEALAELARCDVGLVPHHVTESWQTTIPNKLFDYMSLGKPVIVSNARPAERIVREERCGIVYRDRDVAALADAIVAMGDADRRAACGQRGREAIVRRYNWEIDEQRLLGAIGTVLGVGRNAPAASVAAASVATSLGSER
jgi:glycosyltransferase involved in cell wall biosynthesis